MTTKKTTTKAATTKVAKPTIKSLQADITQYVDLLAENKERLIEREAEIIVLRDDADEYLKQIEQWRESYNSLYKELQEFRTRNWYQRLFNIKGA